MYNPKTVTTLLAVLMVGGAIGYGASVWLRPSEPMSAAASQRKVLYWHDPMVPATKFDQPGKSPFMDMQLVPVYADEAGTTGPQVSVNASVTQTLGVRMGKVERTRLQPRLTAVGAVAFDERLLGLVQARVEGYVTRLHVKAPLQTVRRGQALAEVVAPVWIAAQEEYLALLDSKTERGREIRDSARQRLAVLGVSEAAIGHLESERTVPSATTIYSPADGVLTELAVREGASFASGAPLFRINSLRTVWVNAQIPEARIAAVAEHASVSVSATAWPGESFKGRIVAVLPDVDAATRTLPVRIEIDNPRSRLVPGMFVSMDFAMPAASEQLVVPSEAVITTGARAVVIVGREGGGFNVADVKIGAESAGMTEILSGLSEGQSIVLSGQFLIDSEASLRSTASRLTTDTPVDPKALP
ncbi:MAG: efflux RND transporter periplasmic adaptor subunit [Pseudomonadota bacterium]